MSQVVLLQAAVTSCGAWLLRGWRGCWSSSPSPRLGSSSSFPRLILSTRCPSHLSPPSLPALSLSLSRARCPTSPTSSPRNCCLTKGKGKGEMGKKGWDMGTQRTKQIKTTINETTTKEKNLFAPKLIISIIIKQWRIISVLNEADISLSKLVAEWPFCPNNGRQRRKIERKKALTLQLSLVMLVAQKLHTSPLTAHL